MHDPCLTQIMRSPVWCLPLIMDVQMYDNGYVRLTALRRDAMPFSPTLRIGLNYLALSGLFLQSAVSIQQSAEPTNQHLNNSTTHRLCGVYEG